MHDEGLTPTPAPGPPNLRLAEATWLMTAFAERTGLTGAAPPRRYLWTDAFAVCTFLELWRERRDDAYLELALRLVDQVHHTLGRHRPDDARSGWLSGLSDSDAEAHPTRGGLRIGKPLQERGAGERADPRREWDRDGQYFHYLTQWMHALDQLARATQQARFNVWARELAVAAYHAFRAAGPDGRPMLRWKMSTDLSRAVVPSMGQHDPLDGYVICAQLELTASMLPGGREGPSLRDVQSGFAEMLEDAEWSTSDPLGIGGLLGDACRVHQLLRHGALGDPALLPALLEAAFDGLIVFAQQGELQAPAPLRLPFRELGLSIGLHGVARIAADTAHRPEVVAAIEPFVPLAPMIESFWLAPEHRAAETWTEHLDINEVMLATSLVPEGYLVIAPPA